MSRITATTSMFLIRRNIGSSWIFRKKTRNIKHRHSILQMNSNSNEVTFFMDSLNHSISVWKLMLSGTIEYMKLRAKTFGTVSNSFRSFASSTGISLGIGLFSPEIMRRSFPSSAHNFIADIARKASPAVAFVEIKGEHHKSGKRVTLANGSGFIVSSNGLVLTNAHVVENKSRVNIKLHDGSNFDGVVTVVDPVSDLAVIKIQTDKILPVIPLGKSSSIRPGEFVAAMGSPLSLHKTITVGIVSSPLRDSNELGLNNKMDYIQTDAVIGLGNSGGPLVNMDGQAIGINTLKLTEGISFAIPSDYAFKIIQKAEDLIAKEKTKPTYFALGRESKKRRYMGITMLSLTPAIILELKDKQREFPDIKAGVYVYKVVVSSPAYVGGLHAGDVIVAINGRSMETSADVYSMVENEDQLRVKVLRGKYYENLTIETESI